MHTIITPDLVQIPHGKFLMGENDEDKFANDTERPRHPVTMEAFEIGRFPVTLAEYRLFRPDHEAELPEDWPAARVSWDDAQAYCAWLGDGYRLPTEAEWEYAARGGTQLPYPNGALLDIGDANFYYDEKGNRIGLGRRSPVGAYPANAFGLHDVIGNVCEWVQDAWSPTYAAEPNAGERTLRGGAWDYLPRLLRVSWRDSLPPHVRRDNVGFRVARSLAS